MTESLLHKNSTETVRGIITGGKLYTSTPSEPSHWNGTSYWYGNQISHFEIYKEYGQMEFVPWIAIYGADGIIGRVPATETVLIY